MFTTGGVVDRTTADDVVDGADGLVTTGVTGVIGIVMGLGKMGVPFGVEVAVGVDWGMVLMGLDGVMRTVSFLVRG